MEQQLDGVKVNINNNEKKSSNAPVKKKSEASKNPEEKNNHSGKKQMSLISALIIIIVAVAAVGGGIYAWQNQTGLKNVKKIQDDAKNARMDFEQRLANLKDQISGIEKEKENLASSTEELKTAEELLAKATIEYKNEELGLSFKYPARLGQFDLTIAGGVKGKSFKGAFSKTDKLILSGVTKDYASAVTTASSSPLFMDTTGYVEKNKKFYFQPAVSAVTEDYEIKPVKIIGENENKVLLVDKKSFIPASTGINIDIGENIGAIVNLKNASFSGLAFVNQDFGVLPIADFETILKSILIK